MDAVRKLKVNLKLEHQACGWCEKTLALGDDAAVCTVCERPHHAGCWDGRAGCATGGCVNAPLRQLSPEVIAAGAWAEPVPPGAFRCPQCTRLLGIGAHVCPFCNSITSPDGIYRGPTKLAPGASAAMWYGIVSLFICGIILGPMAISKGNEARRAMNHDPTLTGSGKATAGIVIGYIAIALHVILLLTRFGAARR